MVNYYEAAKAHPEIFKQLACKELLFVHYNCPLEQTMNGKWSQHNYFMYILTGKWFIIRRAGHGCLPRAVQYL